MKIAHRLKITNSKVFLFLAVFVFMMFGTADNARAGVWGETAAATAWKQVAEELAKNLRGIVTGAFKQGVGQVMNTQISAMIGGGGGKGAMFITNWQTFLVTDPRKQTNLYMNDFFSLTTRGRNSSTNYQTAPPCNYQNGVVSSGCVTRVSALNPEQKSWFTQEGIIATAQAADPSSCPVDWRCTTADAPSCSSYGSWTETTADPSCSTSCSSGQKLCVPTGSGSTAVASSGADGSANYYKYQTDTAKKAINPAVPDIDLMNYVRSPSEVFQGGSWRGFNAFFSNSANNPFGYSYMAHEAYNDQLSQEQQKANTMAISYQGFKPSVGTDGVTIKTPGITIGQLVDKVQGFSFDSISSSQDWAQLLSSSLDAAASAAITTAVRTGLNSADQAIQGGLNTSTGALSESTGGRLDLNLTQSSLANVDWSDSTTGGQSSNFNNSQNNFNSDVQNGLTGINQEWGNMNFGSGATGGTTNTSGTTAGQDSYSPLNSTNFNSNNANTANTTPTN
jgi:hypothetical protein